MFTDLPEEITELSERINAIGLTSLNQAINNRRARATSITTVNGQSIYTPQLLPFELALEYRSLFAS